MKIYLPEKLDLEKHVKNFPPPPIPKFSIDKLAMILSQINVVKAISKNKIDDIGAVPLHSGILQKICREYNLYLDYAADTRIIHRNKQFFPGEDSRHYKFNPIYNSIPKVYEPVKFYIPKFVKEKLSSNIDLPKQYKYLSKPFTSGELQIDYDNAKDFYVRQHKYYITHPDKVPEKKSKYTDKRIRKNPYDIFTSAIYDLDRLKAQEYHMSIDNTSGRCHTNITNMPSTMRHFLKYDNQDLVGIDISNCQPYEINGLLKPQIYGGVEKLKKMFLDPKLYKACNCNENETIFTGMDEEFSIYTMTKCLESKLFSNSTSANSIFILVNRAQTSASQEIQRFENETTSGTFYKGLQKHLINDCGSQYTDMGKVKIETLRMIYTSNKYDYPEKEVLKNYYRTIYDITSFFKNPDKTFLPILLQSIESFIMLNRVARRLHRENPKLMFFTVHDSIMTTVGNENYVAEVMKQEFARCIGPVPHIKFEYYRPVSDKILRQPY